MIIKERPSHICKFHFILAGLSQALGCSKFEFGYFYAGGNPTPGSCRVVARAH
jgi:hypothetical protein